MKRGFEILGLAYLFRLQEYLLGGAYDWHDLFRVDILNCIGASMIVGAFITAPRNGRRPIALTAVVAAGAASRWGRSWGRSISPTFCPAR